MKSMSSDTVVPGVAEAQHYGLDDLDRREYIKSQMSSYPDYADRIATEMYRPENRDRYPIFDRAKIHTGFQKDDAGNQWPTWKPGELRFVGWMNGAEHAGFMQERAEAYAKVLNAESVDA